MTKTQILLNDELQKKTNDDFGHFLQRMKIDWGNMTVSFHNGY